MYLHHHYLQILFFLDIGSDSVPWPNRVGPCCSAGPNRAGSNAIWFIFAARSNAILGLAWPLESIALGPTLTPHPKHLGHVCFPESSFRETTFQTFMWLFAIRKFGQRKILSGQWKTLSNQRKIWLGFQESVSLLAVFVFQKVVSGKQLFKLSYICLSLEKLVNGKHFSVEGKFGLVSRKAFSWKIWAESTFRKLWKI